MARTSGQGGRNGGATGNPRIRRKVAGKAVRAAGIQILARRQAGKGFKHLKSVTLTGGMETRVLETLDALKAESHEQLARELRGGNDGV